LLDRLKIEKTYTFNIQWWSLLRYPNIIVSSRAKSIVCQPQFYVCNLQMWSYSSLRKNSANFVMLFISFGICSVLLRLSGHNRMCDWPIASRVLFTRLARGELLKMISRPNEHALTILVQDFQTIDNRNWNELTCCIPFIDIDCV